MIWKLLSFQELTTQQLYDILALRQEVFILEQQCLYPDIDYEDQKALHLLGFDNDTVIAYMRLFPKGAKYSDAISLGRVLTAKSVRGKGYAKESMKEVIDFLNKKYPNTPIIISAQLYLTKFYENFGFQTIGEQYDEDGIPHIKMKKE